MTNAAGTPIHARTIVEDDSVVAEIAKQCTLNQRFEELWDGWKWRLARDPISDSVEIDGQQGARLVKSDPRNVAYGLPTLTLVYTYDENEVVVLRMRIT